MILLCNSLYMLLTIVQEVAETEEVDDSHNIQLHYSEGYLIMINIHLLSWINRFHSWFIPMNR